MLNIQEVYEQYFTVVYRYLFSLSHNTHIAEELTQETFFKALKKIDDFRGGCDLRVWICQISKNTYYDYLKKTKSTHRNLRKRQRTLLYRICCRTFRIRKLHFRFTKSCTDFPSRTKKSFLFVCSENCHLPQSPRCWQKRKLGKSHLSQSM